MAASSIRAGLLVCLLVAGALADLPSCMRAKCVHCAVEFIGRMCPEACAVCGNQYTQSTFQSQSPHPPPPIQQFSSLQHVQQNFQQPRPLPQNLNVQPQIQLQPLQPQPQQQQFAQQVQFAAPVQPQLQPLPYPQQPIATLAPLIDPPRAAEVSSSLSRQPADLAQPLPEYQVAQFQNNQNIYNNAFGQQPQQQIQPAAGYGTQVNTLFTGQPQQTQQFAFGTAQQQSTMFNPFGPFLQQNNVFDPFNLLNFNNNNNNGFGQPPQYGQVQHQGNYSPYVQQQQAAPGYQTQYAKPQDNTVPQQVQPQSVPTSYTPPIPQNPQPQLQSTQYKPPQQVQQPQPFPIASSSPSIDGPNIKIDNYIDAGKGTPQVSSNLAKCPRQPGWAPCISKETANDRFRNCCSRLGDGCVSLCNYDANLATMQIAVLTGRCPLGKVADVMICASGYQDASACCEAYGVFEPGYEHCRPYCNPAAGLPQGGLLSEKYKCLVKLQHIQQCFYVSQNP